MYFNMYFKFPGFVGWGGGGGGMFQITVTIKCKIDIKCKYKINGLIEQHFPSPYIKQYKIC